MPNISNDHLGNVPENQWKAYDEWPIRPSEKCQPFKIEQHKVEPVRPVECKVCGATEFTVGQGNYITALRCNTCLWETVIHSG